MAAGDLESALELRGSGDGTWIVHADPNYESMNGMFGGWTAAVALRAVCDAVEGEAAPSALTVNFVGKVEPGRDILIQTRRVGGGRSVSYWQSELTADDVTLAVASVVLTERRETDGHLEVTMPDAPDPATLEVTYPAPGPWGERSPRASDLRAPASQSGEHVLDRVGA